jgi:hypothetical protein
MLSIDIFRPSAHLEWYPPPPAEDESDRITPIPTRTRTRTRTPLLPPYSAQPREGEQTVRCDHLTDEWCAFTADAASHGYPDWEDCKALSLTIRTTLSAVSWRSFTQIPLRRMKVPGNSSSVAGSWFSLCCLP